MYGISQNQRMIKPTIIAGARPSFWRIDAIFKAVKIKKKNGTLRG